MTQVWEGLVIGLLLASVAGLVLGIFWLFAGPLLVLGWACMMYAIAV